MVARQHGVVALDQLGLSARAVQNRAERGRLHRVHRGVYALSPVLTPEGRLMAAVLACGAGAALSYRDAGHHLGVRRSERRLIEVSVPRGSARSLPGIQVHRMRRMETTVVDGIPCTTLAQTLLDLAETIRPFEVRKAITRAEQLRIFDLDDIERILATANGRRGARILQALLADFEPVATESKLEDLFLPLCPIPPEEQYWIDGYRADFAWPAHMLIAETEGWETHGTRHRLREGPRAPAGTGGPGVARDPVHLPADPRRPGAHPPHPHAAPDAGCFGGSLSSRSAGSPALSSRSRSSSASSSAPSSSARLEIHSQTRNEITPPRVPYVLL
jgi:predicted transcriptional regulator of viral defense system